MTAAGTRTGPSGEPWRGIDPNTKGRHWAIPGFVGGIVAGLGTQDALDALDAAGRLHWPKASSGIPMLKRFIHESKGIPAQDVITDISPLGNKTAERLGYPTQKPLALLERIIAASSNRGDVVLDPFCGCGTTIDAAQKLGRRWLGIDVTYIAVDLIEKRIRTTYGGAIDGTYEVLGIPRDRRAALALFSRSPFEFERWAVTLLNGRPNQRQGGDKGIDGVATFPLAARGGAVGRILISVKGGRQLNPSMVRDLGGTLATQQAEMGILITNGQPTRGMADEANHAGNYQHPHYSQHFPRIQIITVDQLLSGHRPSMPPTIDPYRRALGAVAPVDQGSLFD